MNNNGTIIDKLKIQGGLSPELTGCGFAQYITDKKVIAGYFGSADRNSFRDKALERYLKTKGCLDNGTAFLMASKTASKLMGKVNEDTAPVDFVNSIKESFKKPLETLYDLINKTHITSLHDIEEPISITNIKEVEEGIEKYLQSIKGKEKEPVMVKDGFDFEGRYENTTGSHNKFWEIISNAGESTFTARWGAIGASPQDKKDYTYDDAMRLVREKTSATKGYVKVRS